ncbi:hypothetical protein [Polaromonas sp. CG9_12]|nr:hypothetical protein [Polaromonas sp. CG9_12]
MREPGTLARYFTEPDQVKLLADARAGDYGDLLAQADAPPASADRLHQPGRHAGGPGGRARERPPPAGRQEPDEPCGRPGQPPDEQGQGRQQGYKRADPAALKEAADTLAQQFEAVDAFLARDGAPDAAGDQGEPTQGDQFDSAAFDEKRDQGRQAVARSRKRPS